MIRYVKDLTATYVRFLLGYDPVSGAFVWLLREGDVPFNAQYAGKQAGSVDKKGYRRIKIDARYHAAHRLAWLWMTGEWPPEEVDHINGNRADNRFVNLRLATKSQNQANARIRRHNKVGLKGVCYTPRQGYHAQISHGGKVHNLGFFATAQEAHEVYVRAAKEKHGEFARAA